MLLELLLQFAPAFQKERRGEKIFIFYLLM